MNDTVLVQIPLSRSAAEALEGDPHRREAAGRLLSRIVSPGRGTDPLMAFLDNLPRDPTLPEMSEEEIQAEVDAVRKARAARRR